MNKNKGIRGELIAEQYLCWIGYRVIARNWTCRWGEIDIICRRESIFTFVEVKYRMSDRMGDPSTTLNANKMRKLRRSVNYYLKTYDLWDTRWNIEGIVILHKKNPEIYHYTQLGV